MPDVDALFREAINSEVQYAETPLPVPGDLLPEWRLAALVLLLERCHGRTATVQQIHVFGWAMLTEEGREAMLIDDRLQHRPEVPVVRFDPAWSRVMDLAVGIGLARWIESGRLELTEAGQELSSELWSRDDLFTEERKVLGGRRLTQALVNRLVGGTS